MSGGEPSGGAAWGPARDALSALFNFETLLRSPRVPAQTIAQVTGDVRAASSVLEHAFRRDSASAEDLALDAYATARLSLLLAEIDNVKPAMDARTRLGLERVVLSTAREIDSALELRTLLDRSLRGSRVELSLLEVVRVAAAHGSGWRPTATVTCHASSLREVAPFEGNAALASHLVAACIGRTASEGNVYIAYTGGSLHISAVSTAPSVTNDEVFKIKLVLPIAPTDLVLRTAARSLGTTARLADGLVTLTFHDMEEKRPPS